jgi:mannose-1-phosphate guanylyltransferase/mannose-6-phosphate isomerase
MKIIILAGGGGTRLFPMSRTNFPKQFLSIEEDKSLLGMTIERFLKICEPKDIVIVTGKKYYYQVEEELNKIGCTETNIVAEPCPRNTAPAIALAVKYCIDVLNTDDNEVFFVAPSDHIINPIEKFCEKVIDSLEAARAGKLVTLGINATKPETGYGYIKATTAEGKTFKVDRFVEKPDYNTAVEYLKQGGYYWNAGMFGFSQRTFLDELKSHAQQLFSYMTTKSYDDFMNEFVNVSSISIDYAIAEKSERIAMIPMDIYWNDVGSWDSIYDYYPKDDEGNVLKGDTKIFECKNSMIVSNNRLIVGIGLEDILVVDTDDVIMVSKRGESQKVKEIYNEIKDRNEAHDHTTCSRPWGTYQILSEDAGYKVKKICVFPGRKISLQTHQKRSEHWIVINGEATVVIGGDDARVVRKNESIYVPKQTMHRLMNFGQEILEIIEVQNGTYLGEDDIQRYDDMYTER